MNDHLGAFAALASSVTWAFASAQYATATRGAGPVRVNFFRTAAIAPFYLLAAAVFPPHSLLAGLTAGKVAWLLVASLCSHVVADSLLFAAARRAGISTALAIASCYPLWAALAGVFIGGERMGAARAFGVLLCVGGVVALIRLSGRRVDGEGPRAAGLLLALATSILWACNSLGIKLGGDGLTVWQTNGVRMLISVPLIAGVLVVGKVPPGRPATGWRSLLPALAADGILGSTLYVYGLGHSTLAVGATLSSLSPIFSLPMAAALGQERWSLARFLAIIVTVAGVVALVVGA